MLGIEASGVRQRAVDHLGDAAALGVRAREDVRLACPIALQGALEQPGLAAEGGVEARRLDAEFLDQLRHPHGVIAARVEQPIAVSIAWSMSNDRGRPRASIFF